MIEELHIVVWSRQVLAAISTSDVEELVAARLRDIPLGP